MSHKIIELETVVDAGGNVHIPEEYRALYGRPVRLVLLLQETVDHPSPQKICDPMQFSHTLDWPVDGLDYQHQVRREWN